MTQPIDNQTFQVGGATQPVPYPGDTSVLRAADPSLFFALDFWSFVISAYPGPAILAAATAAGATAITAPVAQRYPALPQPNFQTNQVRFPLLAIGRTTYQHEWKRIGFQDDRGEFKLLYALPPLTQAQAERMLPLLHAVQAAIRKKTSQSFDPQYAPPGGNPGQSPWGLAFACVEEIGFVRTEHGFLEGVGGLFFPCITMTGYIIERDMPMPAAQKFAGGDVSASLRAPDQTTVSPFMSVATQAPPSIASLSTTSGPAAGGTSVTIVGTGFLETPVVLFGTTPADDVQWTSATEIACTTPAVSGGGTVDVSVLDRDGQSAVLPQAFTYV